MHNWKLINEVLGTQNQEEIDNILKPFPDDGKRYTHNRHTYRRLENGRERGYNELLRVSTKPMRLLSVGQLAFDKEFKEVK